MAPVSIEQRLQVRSEPVRPRLARGPSPSLVAAVTSNLSRALAPGNVACRPKASGLPRPSVINVSQLVSLSRDTLTDRVSRLPDAVMRQVDYGLRLVLSL
jgi:mRNA interferase MazF